MEEDFLDNISMDSLSDDFITFDEKGETIDPSNKKEEVTEETTETSTTEEVDNTIEIPEEPVNATEDTIEEPILEVEEEEINNQDTKEETSESKESSSSPISSLASALKEEGVLPNLENLPEDANGLAEAVVNEINMGIQNWVEGLPADLKTVLSNYREGVPLNDLINNVSKQVEYSSITEEKLNENNSLQKDILRAEMSERGYSKERIDKYIQRFEDLGDLADEAKIALDNLKENEGRKQEYMKEQAKQQQEAAQQRQQQILHDITEKVNSTEEIIPNLKINKPMRDKVLHSMTTAVSQDDYGNPINAIAQKRMENPLEFEMKLHYLFNLTNGFEDWSKIAKGAKTSALKEFESKLKPMDSLSNTGRPKQVADQEVDEDLMKGMKSLFNK